MVLKPDETMLREGVGKLHNSLFLFVGFLMKEEIEVDQRKFKYHDS